MLVSLALFVFSCGGDSHSHDHSSDEHAHEEAGHKHDEAHQDHDQAGTPDYTASTSSAFKATLGDLALTYLPIKDALVETDASNTAVATKAFIAQLEQMDKELLQGKPGTHWEVQSKEMLTHAKGIEQTEDVEAQRKHFDMLSDLLISSIKSFGLEEDVFYIQHCPMAFDNTGAEWLSTEKGILNPYFGDKMLRCGYVQETLDFELAADQ